LLARLEEKLIYWLQLVLRHSFSLFKNSSLPISQKTSGYKTENNKHSNLSCEASERFDRIVLLVRVQGDRGLTRDYFSKPGDGSYQPANLFNIGEANLALNRLRDMASI